MKKLILLFIAVLTLSSCLKDDEKDTIQEEKKETFHDIRVEILATNGFIGTQYTTNTISEGKPIVVKKEYNHKESESKPIIYNIQKFPSKGKLFYFKVERSGINSLSLKLYVDDKLVDEKKYSNTWDNELKVSHSFE